MIRKMYFDYIEEKLTSDKTIDYVIANAGTDIKSTSGFFADMSENIEGVFGGSEDMENSLTIVDNWLEGLGENANVTFVGHSKGGAESTVNAMEFDMDAIIFNPMSVNLSILGYDKSDYSASMTVFVVEGELLNNIFGPISNPIDNLIYLPTQHKSWYPSITDSLDNHGMESVKKGVIDESLQYYYNSN